MPPHMHVDPLLMVKGLNLEFIAPERTVYALRNVSFSLQRGEILAIVGESGSGKSVTGLSLLKLHGKEAKIRGEVFLESDEILTKTENEMRSIRGKKIAMIFQEPMTALNPVFTVGFQLAEVLSLHANLSGDALQRRAVELLTQVGIPEAELRLKSYPFQLSGGMRQRILIAMALAAKPEILIADEPTTALDVTIQAQILRLLRSINENEHTAIIFITHDLGVVAKLAHRVAVMYAGEIVETGSVEEIFNGAKHPYTKALLASVTNIERGRKLHAIHGTPPSLATIPQGCAFEPRCSVREDACLKEIPLKQIANHTWRCIHD